MENVTVIIPALNEAGNIHRLVSEVFATAQCDFGALGRVERMNTAAVHVIVVDNGSTDATAAEARSAGAQVVTETRRGYGYACAAGAATASTADFLVFLDGDGSFLAAELPQLLAPLAADEADLVLGSRWRGHIVAGSMPLQQRFGNWLVAHLINPLYGLSITDLGPYRAVRRTLLKQLDMREMSYGWPTEMIVKAAAGGARVREVPVTYRHRQAGRSKVSGTVRGTVLAGWYILKVALSHANFGRRSMPIKSD